MIFSFVIMVHNHC